MVKIGTKVQRGITVYTIIDVFHYDCDNGISRIYIYKGPDGIKWGMPSDEFFAKFNVLQARGN